MKTKLYGLFYLFLYVCACAWAGDTLSFNPMMKLRIESYSLGGGMVAPGFHILETHLKQMLGIAVNP